MTKKYQVFVSSTYEDLKDERDQIIKAILEMGHIPVGMEMFSAADEEQWKIIKRQIDESDYYVVAVAHKYGSVTEEGISYTEKEYDYAAEIGVPVLGFVIDGSASWPSNLMEDSADRRASLEAFKDKIKGRLVNFWNGKDDLHAKVSISLMKSISTNPRTGWVRSDEVVGPDLIKELTRLSTENSSLRKELSILQEEKRKAERESDVKGELFDTLRKNKVDVYVWMDGDENWGDPIEGSLLGVFQAIAPNLMVENDFENIGRDIALRYKGVNYRQWFPVPKNLISHWLADLASLDLIEPSKKKHPVSDKTDYWSLSKEGRSFLKKLRKIQLERGLVEKEKPENEASPPES
ncbi:DUF4062 domain-containing protein [Gilvimarinus xylanilyticus]|uniref:DUF4062 domain-containing protein n=1 Tax=Gilvimarinus xylanilyticus TaxID=2944139 RepID=A0A9X2HZG9_9GAMM|nr:DUF4062 domain-containing protein [Gilvimarinus xylanilyticus]MCP8900574.1 DUF4062 domain-containing protein [Gilvimarinus xylanilyticus]